MFPFVLQMSALLSLLYRLTLRKSAATAFASFCAAISPQRLRLHCFALRRVRNDCVCTVCNAFALETSAKKSARKRFASFAAFFRLPRAVLGPPERFLCHSQRARVHRTVIWVDRNAFALFATQIGPFATRFNRSQRRNVFRSGFGSLAVMVREGQRKT